MPKVLFISKLLPSPDRTLVHGGVYKRMHSWVDAIKRINHGMDALFFVDHDSDISPSATRLLEENLSSLWETKIELFLARMDNSRDRGAWLWNEYGKGSLSIYRQKAFSAACGRSQITALNELLSRGYDWIFVHRLGSFCPLMRIRRALPPILFDLDDVEHKSFLRSIKHLPPRRSKPLYYLQAPALFLGERKAIRLSARTFVCSEKDRAYLGFACQRSNISVIPNCIKAPDLSLALTDDPVLMFIGTYGYPPNAVAADYMITTIWPRIKRSVTNARLLIAGPMPEKLSAFHQSPPDVSFLGFVENLSELYAMTRVVCCPILSGGGTRVKIVEAAAYGKVIVSTTVGAEGLHFKNEKEIFLQDNADDFADVCVQLLTNKSLCEMVGANARAKAIQIYDRASVIEQMASHISQALPQFYGTR
jgi:glycosyltransferase involved in cell wall biosynthesis